MNKKIISILTILLLLSILFSGCLKENETVEENSNIPENSPPIGVIYAPERAYFGDTIEFDASKSYDSDGEIVSYAWDFGDEKTADGKIVKHSYRFENNFTIDYPLIYPIYLVVEDNKGTITATSHQIKIYPKEYVFYLTSEKLATEKPNSDKNKIRGSGLFKLSSPQVLSYELENIIKVQNCRWNATLYLKKPLLSIANKISLTFYDNEGNQFIKIDKKLGSSLWNEKTIKISGTFDEAEEFKSMEIAIYGFSLRKEISLLYGGENPSQICFDLATL
ncbi:MAG: PKD domain-containing protein [Thermoplasmatales archaeon]|nr:PKD domain-containing protein [Thermoplasmatales archaeon]